MKFETRRIVLPLACVQILVWATSFYMFPAMLPTWEAGFGWSKTALSGAFTLAILITACGAPIAGKLIDRGSGRNVLVGGLSMVGFMLLLMSKVTELWQFYLLWAGLGIGMTGALYESCFALVTRLQGKNARSTITSITLIAGFAGALAFPGAHYLNHMLGWRTTVLVYAGIIFLVAIPLMYLVPKRKLDTKLKNNRASVTSSDYTPRQALGSLVFWLVAIGFALIGLNHGMIITHMLPLLVERGIELAVAVLVAAMIGPMQVVGRLLMLAAQKRVSTSGIAAYSIVLMFFASIALFNVLHWWQCVFVFAVLQGTGYGVTSITRPVATAEFLGTAHFGTISGFIAMPYMLMNAISPSVAAGLWSLGGYDLVIAGAAVSCIGAFTCLLLAARGVNTS